ncbi:EAL domain-containing protein [Oxalobacteraceae bacterium OM1]|nr:EAL domain-containing protein [Oxalobacteraceae bacterium OM1]
METPDHAEFQRLQALHSLHILDTAPEAVFDRLTRFAVTACETPIAAITLIDERRQWFKSAVGLDIPETDRAIAFCAHAIQGTGLFIVEDAAQHPLFADNPLVTGPPHLRFYAGAPLRMASGHALGALAVMDRVPRKLTPAQETTLLLLAEQVIGHIELRQQRLDLESLAHQLEQANGSLMRQTRRLTEAQRIAGIGSWEYDSASGVLTCSPEVYRMFGLPPRERETTLSFLSSVHAEDREMVERSIAATVLHGRPLDVQHRIVRPGGEIRQVHQRAEPHPGPAGSVMLAGTVQDVTDEHRSQQELHLLRTSIDRINDIVMITEAEPLDEPGPRIVFLNAAFERITGYPVAEVMQRSPRFLQGRRTDRAELDRVRQALARHEPVTAEFINYRKDGSEFWMETNIAPVVGPNGRLTHFVAIERDVTQRKHNEAEIERLAFYDQLTGLANRRLLMDRLQHALNQARRTTRTGALLFIDLDHFKTLNDTLGHDKGDLLLRAVGERLSRHTRRSNTVARLGGDEFIVMLEDLHADPLAAAAHAELAAEKILGAFAEPFMLGDFEYGCTASVGVALFSNIVNDADDVMRRADIAMYHAKASGRGTARFFDPELQEAISRRVAIEHDMKVALNQGQFVLHYQPQWKRTGGITGVEALIRWQHPGQGMVYPNAFIALAEESDLILRLGQWVLQEALQTLQAWTQQEATRGLTVAINVSVREFRHPDFAHRTLHAISAAGIDPRRLKLELTEGLLIEDFEDVVETMELLKSRGIGFSLDDFGTGYSSLRYLQRLPLDQLKIDQSFVRHVTESESDAAIARTILTLGQTLGMDVIAEGVETEQQRQFLETQGCDDYQGFLFCRPLPAQAVPELCAGSGTV